MFGDTGHLFGPHLANDRAPADSLRVQSSRTRPRSAGVGHGRAAGKFTEWDLSAFDAQSVTVDESGFAGVVDEELRVGSNRSLTSMGIDKGIEM